MIQKEWILVLCFTAFNTLLIGQYLDPTMPSEPGKCYAKCLMPSNVEGTVDYYLLPVQNTSAENFFRTEEIQISDPVAKWVKKLADKNCQSADPNDCLVWCLVEEKPEVEERMVYNESEEINLAYLQSPNDFTYGQSVVKKSTDNGGVTEWKEILCATDPRYSNIIASIQTKLNSLGYYEEKINQKLNPATKDALVEYQEANSLPIGHLDVETLKSLDIEGYATESILGNNQQSNPCTFSLYTEAATALQPVQINREIYTGDNGSKLIYFNYITKADITDANYDINNPYHVIETNRKYQKLKKKESSNFTIEPTIIEQEITTRKGGYESFDCVCLDDENYQAYQTEVEQALSDQGYEVDNAFGEITKRSLAEYQIANHRPIGFLDFGTLELLGIEY